MSSFSTINSSSLFLIISLYAFVYSASNSIVLNNLAKWNIFKEYCSSNGTRINCDFSVSRQLTTITEDNFRVPQFTNSLHVVLGPSTNFILKSGIFMSAKIYDLVIVGQLRDEQVEITSNAFQDQRPYCRINITDCVSVIIHTNAFLNGTLELNIERSKNVIIIEDAFHNLDLRATFKEIQDLRIEKQSMGDVDLKVISSNLNNLYQLRGRLRHIYFSNSTIGIIHPYMFDVHTIDLLSFDKCEIRTIKSRSFTEKLHSQSIQINRSLIDTIESEAFYGSGITNLSLGGNRINTIEANAIRVIAANVRIEKNYIENTYNNWTDVSECSQIEIVNNTFGTFASINIAISSSAQSSACKFEGNLIQKPLPKSLYLLYPFCQIRKISVDYACTCNTLWLEQLSDRDLRSEIYCKDQSVSNTPLINVQEYLNKICYVERKNIFEINLFIFVAAVFFFVVFV